MNSDKANLDGGSEYYSNIDLEDVDIWLAANVQYSLAKMIEARGRKQLAEVSDADEAATGSDAFRAEWEDMPSTGKHYHLMKKLGVLEIGGLDSVGGGGVSVGPSPEGQSVRQEEEDGECDGESVPHYY